ncbi:tRNA (guanine-1-)-methyltransferase [[Clostridium] ultunense Esp]|uniref:tRNA (guanine-N(1)-)-methyltransferase n=1 Tax=[Clostridium] ultunense Esp TaxID=1288971 RepID=M1ZGR5_9FIRM|nr:tRNA (guanosine(37)-N1)-methyltransferase TrmD [Schnuerera ultunensis]CCQ97468.1 tRNA (guanine-1-)-methyltransferase [[Clostridium] ultunense Esp]SHD76993.1 tRNA(m1G37)methyltransferase [[Clostridium] ultunense Esp]
MRIDILTLFPEIFESFERWSMVGRTIDKGLINLNKIDIRDFSEDKHKRVDDYPYGGGPGMVMKPEPIYRALKKVESKNSIVVYLSPQGKVYDQQLANSLSIEEHLILLCGHYEGIDNRIVENYVDLEISIGDYVLTGGEIPAMVLIESIIRLLPGALSGDESYKDESHYNGMLEHPQYTRPRIFNGLAVPDILLSGDHKKIGDWRKYKSLENTYIKRPDLLDKLHLTEEEIETLKGIKDKIARK